VSNRVVHAPESNLFKVVQHQGKIEILGDINCFSSCTVYDVQGGLLGNFEDSIFILTEPSNQILIFKIEGTCGVEYHRIFFQN
jgi:hypothetical protein